MSFTFRTELVTENAIFGTQQAYGKKDSKVSQFLKKIFGLSLLSPAEVCDCLRWNFYPIFRTTSEWNHFATTCQKIILMRTPIVLRLFGPNALHHHWRPQRHVSYSMPTSMHYFTLRIIIFLFWYLYCKKYRTRPTSKWEVSLLEDLKISYIQKRGLNLLKNWTVYG